MRILRSSHHRSFQNRQRLAKQASSLRYFEHDLHRKEREDEEEDSFKKYWDDFPEEDSTSQKLKPKANTSAKTGDLRALIEKKIMDKVVSEKKLEVTITNETV